MSTNTPSPEWERVVRAVITPVLTFLHSSWPGIVLVKIAPDGDVHDMDERHSSERTGPPATSNSHQPRSDGVSSRQACQPPPSNQGDSDREHSQGGTASTVSPPQGPASRGHSGSFEREHVQVLRALLASTGEAAQGRGQRAGMEDAIYNATTQVARNGVRAGLAAVAAGQPFPFSDVSTHLTRPPPSPREAQIERIRDSGEPPQADTDSATPKGDASPVNAQTETDATRRSNIRAMDWASAAEAEHQPRRRRAFGSNSARRHAMSAPSTSGSDSPGDAMEEDATP